jgi:hypothetical protein
LSHFISRSQDYTAIADGINVGREQGDGCAICCTKIGLTIFQSSAGYGSLHAIFPDEALTDVVSVNYTRSGVCIGEGCACVKASGNLSEVVNRSCVD